MSIKNGIELDNCSNVVSYPSIWIRAYCIFIDGAIAVFIVSLLIALPLNLISVHAFYYRFEVRYDLIFLSLSIPVYYLYTVILHARYGKTIGKMIGDCQVVRCNGEPLDIKHALKRGFWVIGFNVIVLVNYFVPTSTLLGYFIGMAPLMYISLDCIVLIFNKRRALHDMIVGTNVIVNYDRKFMFWMPKSNRWCRILSFVAAIIFLYFYRLILALEMR